MVGINGFHNIKPVFIFGIFVRQAAGALIIIIQALIGIYHFLCLAYCALGEAFVLVSGQTLVKSQPVKYFAAIKAVPNGGRVVGIPAVEFAVIKNIECLKF